VLPRFSLIGWAALAGALDCFLGVLMFMLALKRISAHEAIPLANSAPMWGVVAAWLFLHEALLPVTLIAAALVVIGAYLFTARGRGGSTQMSPIGLALALGAGVSWGIAETVLTKYCLSQGMPPATFQLVMVLTAMVLWVVMDRLTRRGRKGPASPLIGILYGILSGFTGFFLGWILWLRGMNLAPASVLAPIRGTTTLFAFAASVVFLHERPSLRAVLAMSFIVAGVLLVLTFRA